MEAEREDIDARATLVGISVLDPPSAGIAPLLPDFGPIGWGAMWGAIAGLIFAILIEALERRRLRRREKRTINQAAARATVDSRSGN